jgi:hypothetical protein
MLLESLANFIDRMVLFAELDNQVAGSRFLGLGLRTVAWVHKKDRVRLPAEVVAQDVKGIERVAEGAGDVFGGLALDQISAQGLVLAVFGQAGRRAPKVTVTRERVSLCQKGVTPWLLFLVNCFLASKRAKTSRGAGCVLPSTRPPAVECARASLEGGPGGGLVGRVIHNGVMLN